MTIKKSKLKVKRGRPAASTNVRIIPVFRKDIDIRKLGQAAIKLATMSQEEQENES